VSSIWPIRLKRGRNFLESRSSVLERLKTGYISANVALGPTIIVGSYHYHCLEELTDFFADGHPGGEV
jgi:hypothetical protein